GAWLEFAVPSPITLERLEFDLVVDGRHSLPTSVDLVVDGRTVESFGLPLIAGTLDLDRSVPISLAIDPVEGLAFRLVFGTVREVTTKDWYSGGQIAMPIAVSEWHLPLSAGAGGANGDDRFDSGCRRDLVEIDGERIRTRVTGLVADAIERRPLRLELCRGEEATLNLDAGTVDIATGRGRDTGIDVDRLVLRTPGWLTEQRASPQLTVLNDVRVSTEVRIAEADAPFWLVLGQSLNQGWQATSTQLGDLGPPTLVDGFANGWLIDPAETDSPIEVRIEWTPQRQIWIALALTAAAVLICVVLLLLGLRERCGPRADDPRLASTPQSGANKGHIIAGAIGVFLFAALNLPFGWRLGLPLSVIVAALLIVSLTVPRAGRALPATSALCLAFAGAFTTIVQFRRNYAADFGWPELFDEVHVLSVLALLLLAAEIVRIRVSGPETPGRDGLVHLSNLPED
ncbi:MAG: hypothetical protein V3V01_13005, partial [Acidimicrobiales bacterium]